MTWFILIAVGFGLGYWMGRRAAPGDERRDAVVGLLDSAPEITNNDVERALGVSDATATRILDILEQSGEITQVGTTGSGVVYRKKY